MFSRTTSIHSLALPCCLHIYFLVFSWFFLRKKNFNTSCGTLEDCNLACCGNFSCKIVRILYRWNLFYTIHTAMHHPLVKYLHFSLTTTPSTWLFELLPPIHRSLFFAPRSKWSLTQEIPSPSIAISIHHSLPPSCLKISSLTSLLHVKMAATRAPNSSWQLFGKTVSHTGQACGY